MNANMCKLLLDIIWVIPYYIDRKNKELQDDIQRTSNRIDEEADRS